MAKILKKKFFEANLPFINEKVEIFSDSIEDAGRKTIKMDITRMLKGKSAEIIFSLDIEGGSLIGKPKKFTVLPFFIRHMLHTGVSYIEDSFKTSSKEGDLIIKPFLITRKKVSRAVSRTLRNSGRNFIEDYLKEKTNQEIFEDILSGQLQKALSLKLKKIYPLGLCEIRTIEIKRLNDKKNEILESRNIEEKVVSKKKKSEED